MSRLDEIDARAVEGRPVRRSDVRDLVAVVRAVEALHRPLKVICLNPSHSSDCDAEVCDTCDNPWPCPTATALSHLEQP